MNRKKANWYVHPFLRPSYANTLAKWEMDAQRDNEKKSKKKLQSNNIKETTKQN